MNKTIDYLCNMNLRILSGSALKVLAMASMVTDHAAYFFRHAVGWMDAALATLPGGTVLTPYVLMRTFGRLAFPLFAFLITEGFAHTHDRKRYALNLLAFAIVSQVPWAALHMRFAGMDSLNVMFTLLLGYLGIWAAEHFKGDAKTQLLCLAGLTAASLAADADFGCAGFAFILMTHMLRGRPVPQAAIGSCMLKGTWAAGLAFIPINMYNGRRGFIRSAAGKYLFYAIYPIHLGLILLLLL